MDDRAGSPLGIASAGVGLLLPLLAGGNVLFLLDPVAALGCFAAASIGFALLRFRLGKPSRIRPPAAALATLFIFIAWLLGQALFRPSGPRALFDSSALACAALFYTVLSFRPFSREELRLFVTGMAAGATATTLYGQYQYWIMYPRIEPLFQRIYGVSPITSINANFYNANCYAPFLAATLIVTLVMAAEGSRTVHRATLIAIPPLLVTLFLTGSRVTVALLVLAGLALFVLHARSRSTGSMLIGLAAAGGAAGWIALDWISPEELWQYGVLGRLAIWHGAADMIADHWALGVGVGRFAEFFPSYQVTSYFTRYPHNLLLEIFAETGIVGLLSLVCFFVAGFGAVIAALRTELSLFGAAVLAAAALLTLHAMVDIDWHAPANPILLSILLTMGREPGAVS